MEKTLDYYMKLPYTIEMRPEPEEGWFVRVKELRGCMSQGDTPEEAARMIQEAMLLWLEVALEEGLPIPEPRREEGYSGKFVVRVPRSLHRELAETAEQEGVSLNQYINAALAHSVGRPFPRITYFAGATNKSRAESLIQEERGAYSQTTTAELAEAEANSVQVPETPDSADVT